MHVERYPSDLVVTDQDFADCGWQNIVAEAANDGYEPLWRAFSTAAMHAMEVKSTPRGKALWLLADACAMRLFSSSDKRQEPFASTVTRLGWRTAGPDDFTEADLKFFSQVVKATDNPWIKARLADLLWVRNRDNSMALSSLDSYLQIPVSTELLQEDWQDCWGRAITLTLMLGKAANEKQDAIERSLLKTLDAVTKSNSWLASRLADLLKQGGLAKAQAATVANKLTSLAHEYDADTDQVLIFTASKLFCSAETWFDTANNKTEVTNMRVQLAECYVREGMSCIKRPIPCHRAAASFYEKAIQTYRTIPRTQRKAHCVDERITELRKQMEEFGELALEDLAEIPYPNMDFREQIELSSQAVQNKTRVEALQAFSCIILPPFRYQDLRQQVVTQLKQPSFSHIIPMTKLEEKDGRVIDRVPSLDTNADPVDAANKDRFLREMTRMYLELVNFYVNVFIWPALGSLVLEHRLREAGLIELASRSSIVPIGRERLFGKALFAGFNHDFVTALHLLVPQVEHMVRYHLKQAGFTTTCLNADGTQTENGLSSLCDMLEMEKVFGEDLTFEIKALFCSAKGPNLRNQLAHGLLDDNDCESIEAIYVWWLGLRLVCHDFWNPARKR
ncbi:MAG: DUF4209 domain-containing protein [Methylococcaceae bacterium]